MMREKYEFTYEVIKIEPNGLSTIEYSHKDYGKVIIQSYMPISDSHNFKQAVFDKLPRQTFYSRKIASEGIIDESIEMSGKIITGFDDDFFFEKLIVSQELDEKKKS